MWRIMKIFFPAGLAVVTNTLQAGTLEPSRLSEALRAQPGESYAFVTSTDELETATALLEKHAESLNDPVMLPVLGGFAATMQVNVAFRVAEEIGVETVWYLHPDEAQVTLNVLQALEVSMAEGVLINNMSLGPPTSFL